MALLAAACGAERTSEDVLDADADETAADTTDVGDDESADSLPTTTTPAPPSTQAPDQIAATADFGGGEFEITHGEMNDIVVPTQENSEFVTLVFGGGRPPGFEAIVLSEQLVARALEVEIGDAGVSVTDDDRASSEERLLVQLATLYPAAPDPSVEAQRLLDEVPYLQFLVDYQAGQDVLSEVVAEDAEPGEGVPCVRHILLETEAEADATVERLEAGEDFAELAMELSTGPSAPSGGDLGCAASAGYVPEFAAAVDAAELGAFVGPVETEFGFHVLVVDRYEVDGRTMAAELLRTRLTDGTVEVDETIGTWDSQQLQIIPAGS